MKLFSSFSISVPALRLPSLRVNLWQVGMLLVSLLLGLTVWFYSRASLPIKTGSAGQEPIVISQLSVEQSYSHAMQLRQAGDLVGALRELKQVAAITPLSVPVLYELGRVEFQLGQSQPAIAHYQAALSTNPDHAPSAYELGSMLVTLGQLDEGIQALQHAVALSPTALYFYDLGIALGRAGDAQAKIEALKAAIVLKPDYADAYLNLGLTYARMNVIPDAKTYLQQARDLYQAEIEALEHAHLGRNSLDAQIIEQMLLTLDSGCGVECWSSAKSAK